MGTTNFPQRFVTPERRTGKNHFRVYSVEKQKVVTFFWGMTRYVEICEAGGKDNLDSACALRLSSRMGPPAL